jgi:hypothetical protein
VYGHLSATGTFAPYRRVVSKSSAQLLLRDKRYHLVPGTALSPFCGRKDCPNIEAVLDRLLLANAPDFINDGIPYHDLFSHELFRRADDRTFTPMLTADQRKGFRNRRVRNVNAIPSY